MKNRLIPLLACVVLAACAARREAPSPGAAVPSSPARPRVMIINHSELRPLRACVVHEGELSEVRFDYSLRTGDSTYQGVPFAQAFPLDGGYAAGAEWFVDNQAIRFRPGQVHVKYGDARVLAVGDVVRIGEYRGVGVYAEPGHAENPEVIYLPVRPGCVFQVYQVSTK